MENLNIPLPDQGVTRSNPLPDQGVTRSTQGDDATSVDFQASMEGAKDFGKFWATAPSRTASKESLYSRAESQASRGESILGKRAKEGVIEIEDSDGEDGECRTLASRVAKAAKPYERRETRGRKAHSKEHEGQYTAEKRAERERDRSERRKEERTEAALAFITDSSGFDSRRLRRVEQEEQALWEEYRECPTNDVVATACEALTRMRKVAHKCGDVGFKGDVGKILWDASAQVAAVCKTLSVRARTDDSETTEELEALRRDNQRLIRENVELRADLDGIRARLSDLEAKSRSPIRPLSPLIMDFDPDEFPALRPAIQGERKRLDSPRKNPPPQGEHRREPAPPITEGVSKEVQEMENRLFALINRKFEELSRTTAKTPVGQNPPRRRETDKVEEGGRKSNPPPSPPLAPQTNKGKKKKKKGKKGNDNLPSTGQVPASGSRRTPNPPAVRQPTRTQPAREAKSAPPPTQGVREVQPWSQVVGRKQRREERRTNTPLLPPPSTQPKTSAPRARRRRRPPATAAVTVTCPEGEYSNVLIRARGGFRLEELGIADLRAKQAATGAMIFEVSGQDGNVKADALCKKLQEIFLNEDGITVARPFVKAELRLSDLDPSVTSEEVVRAIAQFGDCNPEQIKVGNFRGTPRRLRSVWVQCPLKAANKLATRKRIPIEGWCTVGVKILDQRPLQCYKCLEKGHVRAQCSSPIDRSELCYRCGKEGHKASGCTNNAECPICKGEGKPFNHRIGAPSCKPNRRRNRGNGDKTSTPPTPGPADPTTSSGAGTLTEVMDAEAEDLANINGLQVDPGQS